MSDVLFTTNQYVYVGDWMVCVPSNRAKVHVVYNGPYMLPQAEWDLPKFIAAAHHLQEAKKAKA